MPFDTYLLVTFRTRLQQNSNLVAIIIILARYNNNEQLQ